MWYLRCGVSRFYPILGGGSAFMIDLRDSLNGLKTGFVLKEKILAQNSPSFILRLVYQAASKMLAPPMVDGKRCKNRRGLCEDQEWHSGCRSS